MNITVLTLFPEMFDALTRSGITRRAFENGLLNLNCINPRDYATDKHRTVDDRPYGGGPGMVMRVAPLEKALVAAKEEHALKADQKPEHKKVIYMSPQGRKLDNSGVDELSKCSDLIIISGRYEGIDERFIDNYIDEEWSIGDYVLSGGELPAMVLMDALIRKIPGALGDSQSAEQDSFENGLLDCPHYTRPEVFCGVGVPEVLMSGNHKLIERWRLKQALGRTAQRRPDLLEKFDLTDTHKILLKEYFDECETK